MNMNNKVVRFKWEPDRRGFDPEKARAALADHCVPPGRRWRVRRHSPSANRSGPVNPSQGRSRQVKLEKFLQGVDHTRREGARTKAAVNTPHSIRFATASLFGQRASVWIAVASAPLSCARRFPELLWTFRAGESAVAAGALPAQSMSRAGWRQEIPNPGPRNTKR